MVMLWTRFSTLTGRSTGFANFLTLSSAPFLILSVPLTTKHFDVAEEIKAFESIRLTWSGFVIKLKTELYILVNTADT